MGTNIGYGNFTEDEIRESAGFILGFDEKSKEYICGVGQLTTFNQLGFKGINDKPDGWFLPINKNDVAIILEAKSSSIELKDKQIDELIKNCNIVLQRYSKVIGILYNGYDIKVFKNNKEINTVDTLQNKEYYLSLFKENKIDKELIYSLTKKINDCLHFNFGIKNLYHRMIFTACALVAKRFDAPLFEGMNYDTFHASIKSTLEKSLEDSISKNQKLKLLLDVFSEIKMNTTNNQTAINNFIKWVSEISDCLNSDFWNGEDVMGIFFNEFNRYKSKSESGQVFTPDHITSLMYRLIEVNKDDYVLDAACGSGAFLVKSMCNMIKEAGGINTEKSKNIKSEQLFGIEFDREIYALACANMLIHKDGKTNLVQYDTRSEEACKWMESKPITKVLMNPPFETKYGCLDIVKNVLNSVGPGTKCAFILPDKKLETGTKSLIKKILKNNSLIKIIKLPEKLFREGITTSVFIFNAGIPQDFDKDIFACYIEDDGLINVKNQGRHDIKDKWQAKEDYWVTTIRKQSGDSTIQWISPKEHLSYQMPRVPLELKEEDFRKTILNYYFYKNDIDEKNITDAIVNNALYSSNVSETEEEIIIGLKKEV